MALAGLAEAARRTAPTAARQTQLQTSFDAKQVRQPCAPIVIFISAAACYDINVAAWGVPWVSARRFKPAFRNT